MKYFPALPLLLLATSLGACKSASAPTSLSAGLDQDIQLAPAQSVRFDKAGLEVEFIRVTEDSRCPSDTTCVWAGEVKVQLSTRLNSAPPVSHEVLAGDNVSIGALRLTVVDVQPQRVSTRKLSAEDYRVTLKITR